MRTELLGRPLDVDPCALAILLSVVTGVAALADGALAALTIALVALGTAAFLLGIRPRHGGRLAIERRTLLAVSLLLLGAATFFLLPSPLASARALTLALSATPLWWAHRSHPLPLLGGGP